MWTRSLALPNFVALIKLDSRKIEGFSLSNSSGHMRGQFVGVLASQTKFRSVNPGIEKGSMKVILSLGMLFRRLQRTYTCCMLCVRGTIVGFSR